MSPVGGMGVKSPLPRLHSQSNEPQPCRRSLSRSRIFFESLLPDGLDIFVVGLEELIQGSGPSVAGAMEISTPGNGDGNYPLADGEPRGPEEATWI